MIPAGRQKATCNPAACMVQGGSICTSFTPACLRLLQFFSRSKWSGLGLVPWLWGEWHSLPPIYLALHSLSAAGEPPSLCLVLLSSQSRGA